MAPTQLRTHGIPLPLVGAEIAADEELSLEELELEEREYVAGLEVDIDDEERELIARGEITPFNLDRFEQRWGHEEDVSVTGEERKFDPRYEGLETITPVGVTGSVLPTANDMIIYAARFGDAAMGDMEHFASHVGMSYRDGSIGAVAAGFSDGDRDCFGEQDRILRSRGGAPRFEGEQQSAVGEVSRTTAAITGFMADRVPQCNNFVAIKAWADMCIGASAGVQERAFEAIATAWMNVSKRTAKTYRDRLESEGLGFVIDGMALGR